MTPEPSNPIRAACAQADVLTGVPGARLHQGQIASPAPFRLAGAKQTSPARVAEEFCAAAPSLAGTPFCAVTAAGGYLNFTLSEAWFLALPQWWGDSVCPAALETPTGTAGFPASHVPFDRVFGQLLGLEDDPARYARQDGANPGWLVRYTHRRLQQLTESVNPLLTPAVPLSGEDRAVLLAAARLPGETGKTLARHTLALCQAVWEVSPQRLAAVTRLTAGRAVSQAIWRIGM